MAVFTIPEPVDAVAIQAQDIDTQAVSINAALNKITTTIAGVWDLDTSKKEAPDANKAVFIPHRNPGSESVVEGDDRKPVGPVHFQPGGKYRSILKLFIKYENLGDSKFAHGTGWLIRPDVMITAGHNVFAWKANGGRARSIVAYAGYNGYSSINSTSVEVRKAKRVVTTSQWLSNRGSMAHDFAMVMFDEPFTNITPFQYIETPPKDKLELGVVGYPADKIDPSTGERGGRMYELFESTEYNIMEQKDTMLQHFIDSEGGNSGGPVLRASDLCAIATHVYGGDSNTASVLGRYGNPVQDYIAAFDLPLANPGQINLVPVSHNHICQHDAATGHQVKEIARLGDNVNTPVAASDLKSGVAAVKADKPEFWIFEGADEIFKLVKEIGETLGPVIAAPVGSVVVPAIVRGIKLAQPEGAFDMDAALRRAILANSTLLMAEQKNAHEEGWFDSVNNAFNDVLGIDFKPLISADPVLRLPFREVMGAIGVVGDAAERVVADVAGEITRGLIQRVNIPDAIRLIKPESAMDVDGPAADENAVAFVQQLARATSAQEEGWFDDVGDFFKGAADTVGDVVSDSAKLVGRTAVDGVKLVTGAAQGAIDVVEKVPVVGDVFGTVVRQHPAYDALQLLSKAARDIKIESAFDEEPKAESVFDDLAREVSKVAQALILHTVLADQYLTAQMARPVAELKEEGFFDDVGDFFKKNLKSGVVIAKPTVMRLAADVIASTSFGPAGLILGSSLLTAGTAATALSK